MPIALAEDHGFKVWSFDPCNATNSTVIGTAGRLYLVRLPIREPITLSSMTVSVATAGASLTNVGFGYWNYAPTGALLASSVNANGATTTAFQSTGEKTVTFTPFTVSGPVYAGFWFTGTTLPALHRSGNVQVTNFGLAATASRFGQANTGLTTTAPANLSSIVSSALAVCVGAN